MKRKHNFKNNNSNNENQTSFNNKEQNNRSYKYKSENAKTNQNDISGNFVNASELTGNNKKTPVLNSEMQNIIQQFFDLNPHAVTIEKLIEDVQITPDKYMAFFDTLRYMESTGEIMYTKKGRIARPSDIGFVTGIYNNLKRNAYIKTEKAEYSVPAELREGAMHGDFVLAKPIYNSPRQRIPGSTNNPQKKAQILDIISHNTNELCGIFYTRENGNFVVCNDKKIDTPIKIVCGKENGASDGDQVFVHILHHNGSGVHKGEITLVFGKANTREANYASILAYYNIKMQFDNDALAEAEKVSSGGIPDIEYQENSPRVDLRDMNIFTIDSAESKDLDDAISVEKETDGWLLGVHIADVSHYVRAKSALDKEAFSRGTSVYFTDKVVPMLPKELSNGICSLNEGEDRLALSVFMHINDKGEVTKYSIKKSIIKSCVKGVYKEINAILENTADSDITEKYADVLGDIDTMYSLARVLESAKHKRGALDFDIPEAKIILEDQTVVDIEKRERGISDRIIEEFMLICNETVARFMSEHDYPCIYRVHKAPDSYKVDDLVKFISLLGFSLHTDERDVSSKSIQRLLEQIKDTEYEQALSTVILRSMSKAIYLNKNEGHFGLALRNYLHFTSPIRRYPDLIVHRMLTLVLDGEKDLSKYNSFCEQAAIHSSDAEVRAVNAERDITKLYMVLYLSDKIGEVFEGSVSGVTEFGLFIQLDNTVEGLLHISDLNDDYYDFYKDQMALRGKRRGNCYKIGDRLSVKLVKADIISRQIDFILADNEDE